MGDDKYADAFGLIAVAGTSKSKSLEAVEAAREGRFDEARELVQEAENDMKDAHKVQFKMIQQEAKGNPVDVNIILVHAQDHLTMAFMARDFAEEFIHLHEMVAELKSAAGLNATAK